MNQKYTCKCWDSNPYLALQNPVVLSTVLLEPLEFLTNVSEIVIYGPTEIRNQTYCLRKFCPHRTAETFFLKKMKTVGTNTLIKKRPY